jgi:glycogen synthase
MRVLLWSETFWPHIGGVQILGAKLLPALRDRGHQFIVVTRQDYWDLPAQAQYQGIQIVRFPFWKALVKGNMGLFAETKLRISALKRAFAPDLIHIYSFGASVLFHLNTKTTHPVPSLVTIHEAWPDTALEPDALLTQTLRSATWVTSVSASALVEPSRRVADISSCSSVIYNGLDVSSFHPAPLSVDALNLLCVGRLVREKGFDLALKALGLLSDRFLSVRLSFAGDGPARAELEELSGALGLSDKVDFLGWVPPEQVAALINSATLVLMPSWTEGLPLVALEAALMARPVVATRVGGIPEVVLHERTGLLVDGGDWRALAKSVELLLDDPETTIRMGEAARERAVEMFNWERCVDAYDALYNKLADAKPDSAMI